VEAPPRNVVPTYTEIEERIEEFEGILFIHGTQSKFVPFVANAPSA